MIAEAIMYKYPNADPTKDFIVQNDGHGSYIAEWNLRAPIPTQKNSNPGGRSCKKPAVRAA